MMPLLVTVIHNLKISALQDAALYRFKVKFESFLNCIIASIKCPLDFTESVFFPGMLSIFIQGVEVMRYITAWAQVIKYTQVLQVLVTSVHHMTLHRPIFLPDIFLSCLENANIHCQRLQHRNLTQENRE